MNFQEREDQNNFIESLPDGLWLYLLQLCRTTLDSYSSKKPEYNTDSDVGFFLDLLKGKEKSIDEFRDKFKVYIENNGGKFKELTLFPEYFHPRDKKINNFEADKIRTTLYFEKDKTKRAELIEELNKIKEEDNPNYQTLTKIEEAEHCLFWAIQSCRFEFKNDNLTDFLGLPKATLLYGYACGLLGLDIFGTYYKLNEESSKGGKIKAQNDRERKDPIYKKLEQHWDKDGWTNQKKKYARFAEWAIHSEENGCLGYEAIRKYMSKYDKAK